MLFDLLVLQCLHNFCSHSTALISGRDDNFGFFKGYFLFLVFPSAFLVFLVFSVHFATFSCQFSAFSSILWSFPFNSLRVLLNPV